MVKSSTDGNPRGLELHPGPRGFVARRKTPLIIAVVLGGAALISYFAAMTKEERSVERLQPDLRMDKPNSASAAKSPAGGALAQGAPDSGIIETAGRADSAAEQERAGKAAPEEQGRGEPRVVTVRMPGNDAQAGRLTPDDQARLLELREIRRMRAEALRNAISAPMRSHAASQGALPGVSVMMPGQYAGQGENLDLETMRAHARGEATPEARARLAAAGVAAGGALGGMDFSASGVSANLGEGSAADSSWRLGFQRQAGSRFELKTGAVIPAALLSGINSDLAGAITAQVSRDVFDSAAGRSLLIPQGSRLYGEYANDVRMGQERLFVSWKRVIFPDGSSITLGAMAGSDQAGQSGFEDQVNNHYLRIFGSAALMSVITSGITYSVDRLSADADNSIQGGLSVALGQQIGQAAMNILQRNANIAPTLEIRPGYKFSIVVTKDVVFSAPYAPLAAR
jgi:type IV secretion system protein VirB10